MGFGTKHTNFSRKTLIFALSSTADAISQGDVPMSSTNMWSDDSDGSSIASLRGDSGDSSSAQLEGPWSGDPWTYPQTTTLSDSSRQTEMDVDDDVLDDSQEPSTSRQAHFLDDFMSSDDDDDDEELGGGGAHVDILAVTNVLSQGMGLVDDFQPAGSIVPDHPHTGSVGPHAWFPHIPVSPLITLSLSAVSSLKKANLVSLHSRWDSTPTLPWGRSRHMPRLRLRTALKQLLPTTTTYRLCTTLK